MSPSSWPRWQDSRWPKSKNDEDIRIRSVLLILKRQKRLLLSQNTGSHILHRSHPTIPGCSRLILHTLTSLWTASGAGGLTFCLDLGRNGLSLLTSLALGFNGEGARTVYWCSCLDILVYKRSLDEMLALSGPFLWLFWTATSGSQSCETYIFIFTLYTKKTASLSEPQMPTDGRDTLRKKISSKRYRMLVTSSSDIADGREDWCHGASWLKSLISFLIICFHSGHSHLFFWSSLLASSA